MFGVGNYLIIQLIQVQIRIVVDPYFKLLLLIVRVVVNIKLDGQL